MIEGCLVLRSIVGGGSGRNVGNLSSEVPSTGLAGDWVVAGRELPKLAKRRPVDLICATVRGRTRCACGERVEGSKSRVE